MLTYLTDHEPALGVIFERCPRTGSPGSPWRSGADVLIHDSQYTRQEYEIRFGFGHSSTDHVAVFAEKAGVDRLVLFHHDPMHTDAILDEMHGAVVDRWGVDPARCFVAAEGAEFVI